MIWEYKTAINELMPNVYESDGQPIFVVQETDQFLNLMGKQHWELVDVNPILKEGITTHLAYFFKRQVTNSLVNLPDIGYDIDNNGITGSQL